MRFQNLSNIQPVTRQSSARYEFFELEFERETSEIDPESGRPVTETVVPWIEVRPVGEINEPYINAVLRQQAKLRRRMSSGQAPTSKMLEENRRQDRDLYVRHVFTGAWGGWVDAATGAEVPYSAEAATELLEQLPNDSFDQLRAFCNDHSNFRS